MEDIDVCRSSNTDNNMILDILPAQYAHSLKWQIKINSQSRIE